MSAKRLFASLLVGWPLAVAVAFASRVAFGGVAPSSIEVAGWIFLAGAPILTGIALVRSRPGRSVAQILYDTEHTVEVRQGPPR